MDRSESTAFKWSMQTLGWFTAKISKIKIHWLIADYEQVVNLGICKGHCRISLFKDIYCTKAEVLMARSMMQQIPLWLIKSFIKTLRFRGDWEGKWMITVVILSTLHLKSSQNLQKASTGHNIPTSLKNSSMWIYSTLYTHMLMRGTDQCSRKGSLICESWCSIWRLKSLPHKPTVLLWLCYLATEKLGVSSWWPKNFSWGVFIISDYFYLIWMD